MSDLRHQLRLVLADRHGPEASALYGTLLAFATRRVAGLARTRCRGLLEAVDEEEVVAEVLVTLMEGALARFRGDTVGELLAFVRTMVDRTAVRRAQHRLRERDHAPWALAEATEASHDPEPVEAVASPLDAADQAYLVALLQAGSKADLARHAGVSRAAVSQRVARIEARLDALGRTQRDAHDAWLLRAAATVIRDGPD